MAIYQYTLLKYFKSISTWVIIFISMFITAIISLFNFPNLLSYIISIILLFGSIFFAFKGSQTFRDEIEDGTFLVILSKPKNRAKIILFKWFALWTMCALFIFLILLSMSICVIITHYKEIIFHGVNISIYHNLLKVNLILFVIGFIISMLLASVSLMISTKLNRGATIGIMIGAVLSIQIFSGIIEAATTSKIRYNNSFFEEDYYKSNKLSKIIIDDKGLKDKAKLVMQAKVNNIYSDIYNALMSNEESTINGAQYSGASLRYMAVDTNKIRPFSYISYFDIGYQMFLMSKIATSVSNTNKSENNNTISSIDNLSKKEYVDTYDSKSSNKTKTKINKILDAGSILLNNLDKHPKTKINLVFNLDSFINISTLESIGKTFNIQSLPKVPTRNDIDNYFFDTSKNSLLSSGKLVKIKYGDYLNKYAVLSAYIIISMMLVSGSYFIIKRQDFR